MRSPLVVRTAFTRTISAGVLDVLCNTVVSSHRLPCCTVVVVASTFALAKVRIAVRSYPNEAGPPPKPPGPAAAPAPPRPATGAACVSCVPRR